MLGESGLAGEEGAEEQHGHDHGRPSELSSWAHKTCCGNCAYLQYRKITEQHVSTTKVVTCGQL